VLAVAMYMVTVSIIGHARPGFLPKGERAPWSERLSALKDVWATLLLFVVTDQTYTLFDKVVGTYRDNVLTFDLRLPNWPWFALAWIGDVSAVVLIAIRTYRLIFNPAAMERDQQEAKTAE
jgi:hypothetical protein